MVLFLLTLALGLTQLRVPLFSHLLLEDEADQALSSGWQVQMAALILRFYVLLCGNLCGIPTLLPPSQTC